MSARLAVLGAGLVAFSILHTLLAAPSVRTRLEARVGQRPYRILYNLIAFVWLMAVFLHTRGTYNRVWEVRGALAVVLRLVQVGAVVLALASLRHHDLKHFAGLRQRRGEFVDSSSLQTGGPYALCRHPLYLAVCLVATATPTMDRRGLVIALWLWAYSWVGSVFEEHKLRAQFGDAYRHYAALTPRLLPWRLPSRHLRRRRPGEHTA